MVIFNYNNQILWIMKNFQHLLLISLPQDSEIMQQLDIAEQCERALEHMETISILGGRSERMNRMFAQVILALRRKINFHQELVQRATNTN